MSADGESDVIIGAPFSFRGDGGDKSGLLGSLIWLLMRLRYPRGFRSTDLNGMVNEQSGYSGPCRPTESVLSLVLLMMAIMVALSGECSGL
jgi:hypothetical protein